MEGKAGHKVESQYWFQLPLGAPEPFLTCETEVKARTSPHTQGSVSARAEARGDQQVHCPGR